MARATRGPVESHSKKVREMHFYVDGTGTASLTLGSGLATLTDNGTGDYTLTYTYPGQRVLNVSFFPITKVYAHTSGSTTAAIRVLTFNDAGSATDADFYLKVTVSDSAYE